MKRLIILSLFLTQFLFAQSDDLTVDLREIEGSKTNRELTLTYNLSAAVGSGILIEAPQNMRIIPISIKIDGQNMWLQKTTQVSSSDSVICWEMIPQGLVLLLNNKQVSNSGQLIVESMVTYIRKTENSDAIITIRAVQNDGPDFQLSNDVKASAILPLRSGQ